MFQSRLTGAANRLATTALSARHLSRNPITIQTASYFTFWQKKDNEPTPWVLFDWLKSSEELRQKGITPFNLYKDFQNDGEIYKFSRRLARITPINEQEGKLFPAYPVAVQ